MKLLLVSPEASDLTKLQALIQGVDREDVIIFHYYHPLKAIDNLEELAPDVILWSIIDFPRHWKTLIPFAQGIVDLPLPEMILFASHNIEAVEIDKANTLGVTGIIQQGLGSPEAQDVIKQELSKFPIRNIDHETTIVGSQTSVGSEKHSSEAVTEVAHAPADIQTSLSRLRYEPEDASSVQLVMTHPLSLKLIRGKVYGLDPDSIEFSPEHSSDLEDLPSGSLLRGSRLKLGSCRLNLDLKLNNLGSRYDLVVQDPQNDYLPVLAELIHAKAR